MASRTISRRFLPAFSLLALFILSLIPSPASAKIAAYDDESAQLTEFVQAIANGNANQLRGVYVPDVMALPVMQQPKGNPGYVSNVDDTLTQFDMANAFGNIGLLAHNYLAGDRFTALTAGQQVYLVYGDGSIKAFIVTRILRYQAHEPNNPRSYFTELDSGLTYSAEDVFRQVYAGDYHVTLQTCIANGKELSWGRLFVMAVPFERYYADIR